MRGGWQRHLWDVCRTLPADVPLHRDSVHLVVHRQSLLSSPNQWHSGVGIWKP